MNEESNNFCKAFERRMNELLVQTEGKSSKEINTILLAQVEHKEDKEAIKELCEDNDMFHEMCKDYAESGLSIIEWFRKKVYELLSIEKTDVKYGEVLQLENQLSIDCLTEESHLEVISEVDFKKCQDLGIIVKDSTGKKTLDDTLVEGVNSLFDDMSSDVNTK